MKEFGLGFVTQVLNLELGNADIYNFRFSECTPPPPATTIPTASRSASRGAKI